MTSDIRVEIDRAPVGRYHYQVATLVAFIVFFEGYDTFNASYVIHFVAGPWHLRPGQAGLLVSSGIIGFSVAALAQGMFADRFGRRLTLIAALWTATIFSFCTAVWADSFGPSSRGDSSRASAWACCFLSVWRI